MNSSRDSGGRRGFVQGALGAGRTVRIAGSCFYLAMVVLALLACKKGPGKECKFNKDCADNLVCLGSVTPSTCKTIEDARTHCAATEFCKLGGQCGVTSIAAESVASCAPTSDEHCKQSTSCAKVGMCTYSPSMNSCQK
jgi:hypothetical protein